LESGTVRSNSVLAWFASPWVGLIGTAAAILGLGFAWFTYSNTQRFRKLTYYVHPIRTVVIKSDETTGLRVLHRGQQITGDVTAAQIAVWNQGSEPIRREDILDEVRIVTSPRAPILEASVRKVSREIIGLRLDDSRRASGMIPLSWKILERDDGGVVQLIYAGPATVGISVVGAVVGQSQVSAIRFTGTITSPSEQLAQLSAEGRWFSIIFGVLMLVSGAVFLSPLIRIGLKGEPIPWREYPGNVIFVIILIIFWVLVVLGSRYFSVPSPPFGI